MSEWQKVRFLDVVHLNPRISLEKGVEYPFVEMSNVVPCARKPEKDVFKKYLGGGTKFEQGDTIVARIEPCLQNGKGFQCSYKQGFGSTEFLVFRPVNINDLDCDFLYYYMGQQSIREAMAKTMVGASGRQRVNNKVFNDLQINLPPLQTQHRIATILSRYDSLIENYQKQIKLLEEAAQRLYKEWFIDLRFPGHENTKIVDGVPEGWEIKSITNNHLFDVAKCRIALFNGNKTYYATADVEGTYFCNSGVKIEYDNKPSRAQIQPSLYSVWFARMSNSFKIVGFVEQNNNRREDSILSSGFAGFESHYERFGFLYCLISSQWFNDQKDRYATGATQVSITNEGLSRIRCLLPTTRLAEEFSLVTNKIIEETILYRENCTMLTEARDRLLPKLMSGEIEI